VAAAASANSANGSAVAAGAGAGAGAGVVQRACASGDCQTVVGIDYFNGYKGKSFPAADADECCALCVKASKDCWAATLYQKRCYFKPKVTVTVAGTFVRWAWLPVVTCYPAPPG
jgi:hypothetical protein